MNRWCRCGWAMAMTTVFTCSAHAQDDGRWKGPEQVYGELCGACHEHGVGPTLKGLGVPVSMILKTVRDGEGAMPAFRVSEIDDTTLAALAQSLHTSTAGAPK